MATFAETAIGELVERVKSWSPATDSTSNEFTYIDLSSVDKDAKCITNPVITNCADAPSRARQLVAFRDVLVSTVRPNLNGVAAVPPELDGATASTGFCVLRPRKEKICWRYLYHWVRSPAFIRDMTRKSTGASYPAVSDRIIHESRIPLPKLEEQKRIAAILDKADSIRRKRQEVMQELKNLRLAAFYGLFRQDLALDNMKECLTDVAEVVSGVAKGRKLNGSDTREVPYLRVANVQSGYLDLSEIKKIPAKETEINAYSLRIGDIVMTEGGDHDKLGRGALWERDILNCIHQNHVFRVRLNQEKLLPRFFVYFLQSSIARQYFLRCAKKTTNLASINMTQLRALPVPRVPLVRQEVFEAIVVSIDSCLERQALFSTEAEDLFSSLVQRAFKGEL